MQFNIALECENCLKLFQVILALHAVVCISLQDKLERQTF